MRAFGGPIRWALRQLAVVEMILATHLAAVGEWWFAHAAARAVRRASRADRAAACGKLSEDFHDDAVARGGK